LRADRAPIQRIKDDHYVLLTGEIGELNVLVVLILQRKIRRCLSNCNRHYLPPCMRTAWQAGKMIEDSPAVDKAATHIRKLESGCKIKSATCGKKVTYVRPCRNPRPHAFSARTLSAVYVSRSQTRGTRSAECVQDVATRNRKSVFDLRRRLP